MKLPISNIGPAAMIVGPWLDHTGNLLRSKIRSHRKQAFDVLRRQNAVARKLSILSDF